MAATGRLGAPREGDGSRASVAGCQKLSLAAREDDGGGDESPLLQLLATSPSPGAAAKNATQPLPPPPPVANFSVGGGLFVATCQSDGYCFKSVHRQPDKTTTSFRYQH